MEAGEGWRRIRRRRRYVRASLNNRPGIFLSPTRVKLPISRRVHPPGGNIQEFYGPLMNGYYSHCN